MSNDLLNGLGAVGPAGDRAGKMALYGWLVGRWTIDAVFYTGDGKSNNESGDIWAGWVLEGRAIQDVWRVPGFFHGTTLRVYDPGLDAWHIIWSDPLKQYYTHQIGRADGRNIVQEGTNNAGEFVRWSFSDITGKSFHWRGERSRDGGKSWATRTYMSVRRISTRSSSPRPASGSIT